MRNEENVDRVGRIARGKRSITSLSLMYGKDTLLVHHLSSKAGRQNNKFLFLNTNYSIIDY